MSKQLVEMTACITHCGSTYYGSAALLRQE